MFSKCCSDYSPPPKMSTMTFQLQINHKLLWNNLKGLTPSSSRTFNEPSFSSRILGSLFEFCFHFLLGPFLYTPVWKSLYLYSVVQYTPVWIILVFVFSCSIYSCMNYPCICIQLCNIPLYELSLCLYSVVQINGQECNSHVVPSISTNEIIDLQIEILFKEGMSFICQSCFGDSGFGLWPTKTKDW